MGIEDHPGPEGDRDAGIHRLLERDREIASVESVLDRACGGDGGMLLLEGGAGLGKSRLLAEVASRARRHGMAVRGSRALVTEGEFPFALVSRLFEGLLANTQDDEREPLFEGAASLAKQLLIEQHGDDPEVGRTRALFPALHGLHWLTVNLAQRQPLLLCVDDLHWSDEQSLRFLLYLAPRLEGLPVALVMSSRPPGADGDGEALAALRGALVDRRLCLRELGLDAVAHLVRASLPSAGEELCAVCAEITKGNPFYVREVLLTLAEQCPGTTAGSIDGLRALAGESIARAGLSRLVRVGPQAVALGRALAILDDGAPLRQAAKLAQLELSAAASAADALVDEDVLAPGEPLAFAHSLIRDQVYRDSPAQQRGLAHLRAARLLAEEDASPEQVAAQLLSAPPTRDPWVVEALRAAADRARTARAPATAARYLQRAIEEPPPPTTRCAVLVALGDAEAAAGRGDIAAPHLAAALELEADPSCRVRIWRLLGGALAGSGETHAAADALEQAVAENDGGDQDTIYALVADYLTTAMFDPALRQRALERAEPLLGVSPNGTTPAERQLLTVLAVRAAQAGEPPQHTIELARRAWAEGELLADEGPDGPGWLMLDWALDLAEEFDAAQVVSSAVIEASRRAGSAHAFANASFFHGHSCYRLGQLTEAQADVEQAIETSRLGWRRYLVGALVLKANVLLEIDDADGAADALAAALAARREPESMFENAWYQHACGLLELARSRPEEALDHFEQAGQWLSERLLAGQTVLPWRADAALAALAVGDRVRARALIEPARTVAVGAATRVQHGRLLRVLGLVESGQRGLDLLERSAQVLAGTPALLEHAYALSDLGSEMRRAGRRSDSRTVLARALDAAHRLGARRLERSVREELIATGARPRRALISGTAALTPSEQRVARLAVQGLSNPRIAQALFVTPKTVEFHLRHVYQKLDIPGRSKLAAALAQPELDEIRAGAKD